MSDTQYKDIINLSRPVSKRHAPMSLLDRAAQFAPFAALNGKKLHTLRHITTFIYSSNDVSESFVAARAKVDISTSHAVMVGNITSAESKLTDFVFERSLLEGIGSLLFKHDWPDHPFHIFAPELRTFFLSLTECYFLRHADYLHIVHLYDFMFHIVF